MFAASELSFHLVSHEVSRQLATTNANESWEGLMRCTQYALVDRSGNEGLLLQALIGEELDETSNKR